MEVRPASNKYGIDKLFSFLTRLATTITLTLVTSAGFAMHQVFHIVGPVIARLLLGLLLFLSAHIAKAQTVTMIDEGHIKEVATIVADTTANTTAGWYFDIDAADDSQYRIWTFAVLFDIWSVELS